MVVAFHRRTLIQAGADVQAKDSEGKTAADIAKEMKNMSAFEYLSKNSEYGVNMI